MAEALSFGEPPIEVRLRRNARSRRLVLRVGRGGGGPVLTLPPRVPVKAALAFLSQHETWLRGHLARIDGGVAVGEGACLPVAGCSVTVCRAERGRTRREGDRLLVAGPPRDLAVRTAAWLREAARAAVMASVERHAPTLGRRPRRVALRDPRSRWGSCTANGDLMLSWRLILAPPDVLDYVVAHEMAHLVEMNHAPAFWRVVEGLRPDYAAPRGWLRRNGPGLHAYGFARLDAG